MGFPTSVSYFQAENVREKHRTRKLAVGFNREEFRIEALDCCYFFLINHLVHVNFCMGPSGQIEAYFLREHETRAK
jgi:hypothetical protein